MSQMAMEKAATEETVEGVETGSPALDGLIRNAQKVVMDEAGAAKGAFSLFGLFEREDTPGVWDVLVSHQRLKAGRDAYLYIAERLVPLLSEQEAALISRIVVLDTEDQFVQWVNRMFPTGRQARELPPGVYSGVPLTRAFVITSRRHPPLMQAA